MRLIHGLFAFGLLAINMFVWNNPTFAGGAVWWCLSWLCLTRSKGVFEDNNVKFLTGIFFFFPGLFIFTIVNGFFTYRLLEYHITPLIQSACFFSSLFAVAMIAASLPPNYFYPATDTRRSIAGRQS